MSALPPFIPWPKMARLSRDVIVTEKIDGTNAQVHITEHGDVIAGSRTRWITPQSDNYGFAAWVEANRADLLKLGPGSHFGEWWGKGIQRGYGLNERRFSLFNVTRWWAAASRPECCLVVPQLFAGNFDGLLDVTLGSYETRLEQIVDTLRKEGSRAAPGFMKPEGIVVFHVAGNVGFKKALEGDEKPKGAVES